MLWCECPPTRLQIAVGWERTKGQGTDSAALGHSKNKQANRQTKLQFKEQLEFKKNIPECLPNGKGATEHSLKSEGLVGATVSLSTSASRAQTGRVGVLADLTLQ